MIQPNPDPSAEARRRMLRRATFYSYGLAALAILVALIGAAFVAWLLRGRGLPFVRTWLMITAILVIPGLVAAVWNLIRER